MIEVLIVVGLVAVLAGTGVAVVGNVRESARVSKLENDVATINSAIQVYQTAGGTLPNSPSPQEVLNKLKTKANSDSAAKIAGFHGSTVDPRLKAEFQSSGDASSSKQRALWDSTAKRFVIVTSGAGGVDHFSLDEITGAADYGTETRTQPQERGTNTSWVWNYTDTAATAPTGPETPGSSTAPGSTAPTASAAQQLSAPQFSPSSGEYVLGEFEDFTVTISESNPEGVSQIWYNTGSGEVLYIPGTSISVEPGDTITATARTIDPDRWTNSNQTPGEWTAIPFEPQLAISVPAASMTYAQAGGAMTSGSIVTPSPATISITNIAEIPTKYLSSAKFQVYYTLDGTSPLTSGTAGSAFNGSFVSPSIGIALANWGSASSLVISAAARKIDEEKFADSTVTTATISISPTTLASPTIDPASGPKAADLPVSLALGNATYPTNARIYYTTDGSDPGNANGEPVSGTLYTGQFNSGLGTNGVAVITARVYGPAGYGQWFTPSPAATATYTIITLADGALVGSATLNGTFVGSLVYALPASGSMNSITFNSGARILSGNLYLPGTPTIRMPSGTVWSPSTDSSFSAVIQGWEYNSSNVKTVQTTPRVINENGSATPSNYSVTFNSSSLLEGKVIRRHNSPAFPTIAPPGAPDSSGSASLNSPPAGPISASQYATVTINSSGVGDVRLNAGDFSNLTANNGTAFVLGDPNNPEVTQYYSFSNLTLNSSSDLKIVGKVVITVSNSITINSGSVLGNSAHPEWLQLQFSSGSFTANSGSTMYGQLVAPTSSVTFNAGSVFQGSVTAQSLTINSSSVVFSLPPVIQN